MLKTFVIVLIFIFVVRTISRKFLSPGGGKKNSNFRFFYQAFKNVRQQQKQQKNNQRNERTKNGQVNKDDLNNIEEAEYEEIDDEDSEPSS